MHGPDNHMLEIDMGMHGSCMGIHGISIRVALKKGLHLRCPISSSELLTPIPIVEEEHHHSCVTAMSAVGQGMFIWNLAWLMFCQKVQ